MAMDFYTAVLRQSDGYWVSLCLENGMVGQGTTQEKAIASLQDAIGSWQEAYEVEADIYCYTPISVEELHEFLQIESAAPIAVSTVNRQSSFQKFTQSVSLGIVEQNSE